MKKSEVAQVYKGADEESWQELLDDLRPQGEWIERGGFDGDSYYECSKCGEPWILMNGDPKDNNMNFCPNCGARMGGEEE